jgi:maleate isomerase
MTRPPINYGGRARLGMLLPSSNRAAEPQFHALLPEGVSLHVTRLKLTGNSEQDLLGMAEGVEPAARLLTDCGADLVVFHCTAVSTFSVALEHSIKERIERASARPASTTSESLVAALRALDARRIVMLSPYVEAINLRERAFFESAGFEVIGCAGLDKTGAEVMMGVTPAEWQDFARAHRDHSADAYVMSCTTVRTVEVAEEIERELGRPVVTSNTATAWHCLRRMGIEDRIAGYGCLLEKH